MVSSSVPLYPDWHQQRNQVQGGVLRSSSDDQNPQHNQFFSQPQAAMPAGSGNMGMGSRPGSMAERARMANLQQPQAALKCPRCDSNNTKFCYFNNYSLSQPRHFCKTCRRYWTRGGAMRNVPVGGGCRRNKRNKSRSSRSKSPAPAPAAPVAEAHPDILSHLAPLPQLPFLPPSALHQLGEFGESELGLNFGGAMMMSAASEGGVGVLSGLAEQWRMQQQFPLLASGLDAPVSSGLFHSTGQGEPCVEPMSFCGGVSQLRARQGLEHGMTNQVGAVKLEEQNLHHKGGGGLMMTSTPSRNISGISMNHHHHHQYGWAGDQNARNAWPHDLSPPGFTSSFSSTPTSHLL